MWEDGVPTITSEDQRALEGKIRDLYKDFVENGIAEDDERLVLARSDHAEYLCGGLGQLPAGFSSLDASRPWICYWILHSLALLDHPLPDHPSRQSIISFLASCQHPTGGFGGGPFQLPHLATTYAAVAALVTLGGSDALSAIHRDSLFDFFLRMCVPQDQGGGMTLHEGGEVDIRGCYCALACCSMLALDSASLAVACSLHQYVSSCQSMEGGIGGEPGNEAHGGYAFCGFAALLLADGSGDSSGSAWRLHDDITLDLWPLAAWASRMQGWMEGGFMGRTSKLVDGCYSFWQGATFPLMARVFRTTATNGRTNCTTTTKLTLLDIKNKISMTVDEELTFIKSLDVAPPTTVASTEAEKAQQRVDTAVEDSVRFEEQYKNEMAEHSDHAEVRKADALMALEEAQEAQDALEKAAEHAASASCAAASLIEAYRRSNVIELDAHPVEDDLLYDPLALQLWLLACCQGKRGLRDKPGKHPDYYHTCYCLSGLSSAQHASGHVLGGKRNQLVATDSLCNVVTSALVAARSFFHQG